MEREEKLGNSARREVQIWRTSRGWTQQRRERFLDHLAATCNVTAAVEAVGLSITTVYALRRRDPAFAEQWRMALLAGYDRLEEMLLRKAIAALEGVEAGDPDKVVAGPMTVEQAIRLLNRNSALAKPSRQRPTSFSRASEAQTNALLIQRIKAMRGKLDHRA